MVKYIYSELIIRSKLCCNGAMPISVRTNLLFNIPPTNWVGFGCWWARVQGTRFKVQELEIMGCLNEGLAAITVYTNFEVPARAGVPFLCESL